MLIHCCEHFGIPVESSLILKVLAMFPGVPIFFFVSGFLISASFERTNSLRDFYINRFLRIYPGLWLCLIFSLGIVLLSPQVEFEFLDMLLWVIAQASAFQFYNPSFLRGFGVGVLNGSLWTIVVEIQFYLMIPLIYWLFSRAKWRLSFVVPLLFILISINQVYVYAVKPENSMLSKLLGVSLLPYLYMFLFGVVSQRNILHLKGVTGAAGLPLMSIVYISSSVVLGWLGLNVAGNNINPISACLISLLALALAYSRLKLLVKIKLPDISYGIYIYHMLVVNCVLEYSEIQGLEAVSLSVVVTLFISSASWYLVEKPCLKLKRNGLKLNKHRGTL